ncbi:ATP synthase F1 subunit epsilon [Rhodohalobacter sp. 8-1]|uniref:ATP synthase F1 subunit epsilon n=1 Tax=Rhodohalobacter sp. 8-1 TaxID=3131972 RepID=UPI0030EB8471
MANEKTFQAQVLTPEGSRFSGDVVSVSVPGASGSFQMLHNHAPIISALDVGRVEIQKPDNSTLTYAVSGGFVEMNDNQVTLLAERAIEPGDIDVEEAKKKLSDAKEKLKDSSAMLSDVEHQIKDAQNLIKMAGNS